MNAQGAVAPVPPGLEFVRLSSSGNDFLLLDGHSALPVPAPELARRLLPRRVSLGADGLLVFEEGVTAPFRVRHWNPDGSEGEMCGNGALSFARVAYERLRAKNPFEFETLGGVQVASVDGNRVSIRISELARFRRGTVQALGYALDYEYVEVAHVPHVVIFKRDSTPSLESIGGTLAEHADFERGANVNFVTVVSRREIQVQTYERGVNALTLSCGTGSIAAADVCRRGNLVENSVQIGSAGGYLDVAFDRHSNEVWLSGVPKIIEDGIARPEAWS